MAGLGLAALAVLVGVSADAEATHWRGGHLQWTKGPFTNAQLAVEQPGYNTVFFTGELALRLSYYPGASVGSVISAGANIDFGDGSSTVPVCVGVTKTDAPRDWLLGTIGTATSGPMGTACGPIEHVYDPVLSLTTPWTASITSCCRIEDAAGNYLHENNDGGKDFRLQTTLFLPHPVQGNPAPNYKHIVPCPGGSVCQFTLGASDVKPALGGMSFRVSASGEAGGGFVQPTSPSGAQADFPDPDVDLVAWDTAGVPVAASPVDTFYSMQAIVSNSGANTPVDFLIKLNCEGQAYEPRNLQARTGGAHEIVLDWEVPAMYGCLPVYNVYRLAAGGPMLAGTTTATHFVDTGLQSCTHYDYYVTAQEPGWPESDPSNIAGADTWGPWPLPTSTGIPGAPPLPQGPDIPICVNRIICPLPGPEYPANEVCDPCILPGAYTTGTILPLPPGVEPHYNQTLAAGACHYDRACSFYQAFELPAPECCPDNVLNDEATADDAGTFLSCWYTTVCHYALDVANLCCPAEGTTFEEGVAHVVACTVDRIPP